MKAIKSNLIIICCLIFIFSCSKKTILPTQSLENKTDQIVSETTNQVTDTIENKVDEEFYTICEEMPVFPGGEMGMMDFLRLNIKYPTDASKLGIEGVVYIEFIVEKNGKTSNHKVIRSLHKSIDEEALRVARLLEYEAPGKQKGTPVRLKYTIPIKFALSKKE